MKKSSKLLPVSAQQLSCYGSNPVTFTYGLGFILKIEM